jgi:heat shock protein HtpX
MNNLLPTHYKFCNYLYSAILFAGMVVLLCITGWLVAGSSGIAWFLLAGALIFISASRLTPQVILRLHRAKILQPGDAPRLYEIITRLAERAKLKQIPMLYYIPGSMINAFTTGLNKNAVIALSDGMLQQLNTRELIAVLAHEISHISSNDLFVMLLADVISRLTSIMAFAGYILIWIYIPQFILMGIKVPWMLLLVLIIAPSFSLLMQLALSRAHEFNADIEAAKLTGDPLGLASALEKIEYYQGGWIERMFIPYRRMREPALLRSHPLMLDRVNRLKELASEMQPSGHFFDSSEKHNRVQFPSSEQVSRGRFFGFWL